LNVEADALASRIQRQPKSKQYHTVPLNPFCNTHLDIDSRTITAQYKSRIRRKQNYEPLRQYIARKNQWDESIMKTIDWKVHRQALQRKHSQRQHYCKLVHDIVPTNAYVHKMDPYRNPVCPRCGGAHES